MASSLSPLPEIAQQLWDKIDIQRSLKKTLSDIGHSLLMFYNDFLQSEEKSTLTASGIVISGIVIISTILSMNSSSKICDQLCKIRPDIWKEDSISSAVTGFLLTITFTVSSLFLLFVVSIDEAMRAIKVGVEKLDKDL